METVAKNTVLKIHPKDNVLVALQNMSRGTTVRSGSELITLQDAVHAKHKFFIKDICILN